MRRQGAERADFSALNFSAYPALEQTAGPATVHWQGEVFGPRVGPPRHLGGYVPTFLRHMTSFLYWALPVGKRFYQVPGILHRHPDELLEEGAS